MTDVDLTAPLPPVDLPAHTSIKVIGLGGVGGVVCRYLAVFLASLSRPYRLVLVDGDRFEPGNASRMIFASPGNKAEVLRDELLAAVGAGGVAVSAVPEFVTPANVGRLIRSGDVVLLAVDNHATRQLVDAHCAALDDIVLISGGNDGVGVGARGRRERGTAGDAQAVVRRGGEQLLPPMAADHPEIAAPADRRPDELSCVELQASQPQLLFTNLTTAACMLNTLLLWASDALAYREVCFDIAAARMRPVA